MLEPLTVLRNHLELCSQVYSLLLEENTWLKTEKKIPDSNILERKQELLPKLEVSLLELKKLKPEFFSPFDNSKQLVKDSHSQLLKIFYLDRENEELLAKVSQPLDRQNFNRFTTPPEQIDDIHKRLPENDSMDQGNPEQNS